MYELKNFKLICFISFCAIIVLFFSTRIIKNNKINDSLDIQITELKKELVKEEEILNKLQEEKNTMDSDTYLENIARNRLGLVKPDEIIFKLK